MKRTVVNRPQPKLDLKPTKINLLPIIDAVRLQLDVHISKDNLYEIYSDIMISLMKDLDKEEFLGMVKKNKTVEDIFLRNKVFGVYLIRYLPNEYKKIKASDEYQKRSKDSSNDFTLYEIQHNMFPSVTSTTEKQSLLNNYYTDEDVDTMKEFGGL